MTLSRETSLVFESVDCTPDFLRSQDYRDPEMTAEMFRRSFREAPLESRTNIPAAAWAEPGANEMRSGECELIAESFNAGNEVVCSI